MRKLILEPDLYCSCGSRAQVQEVQRLKQPNPWRLEWTYRIHCSCGKQTPWTADRTWLIKTWVVDTVAERLAE
jgi:hypothetical protein